MKFAAGRDFECVESCVSRFPDATYVRCRTDLERRRPYITEKRKRGIVSAVKMTTSWQFFAVSDAASTGFSWHWQKRGAKVFRTSAAFDFYFDCVADARAHGYVGALPAGPKVPLQHLPVAPIKEGPATAARRPGSTGVVVTVTAVSAAGVRKRRARSHSGVS
jgi:hypothetical protein